jgi:hypothetical protein
MNNIIRRILAVLLGLSAVAGCPQPMPGPGHPGIIDCSTQAVRDFGIPLIPKINDCLVGVGGWTGCLIGLINPAVGITEDVIACVVKSSGKQFGEAADANKADTVSSAAASHAKMFLSEKGYTFK